MLMNKIFNASALTKKGIHSPRGCLYDSIF